MNMQYTSADFSSKPSFCKQIWSYLEVKYSLQYGYESYPFSFLYESRPHVAIEEEYTFDISKWYLTLAQIF